MLFTVLEDESEGESGVLASEGIFFYPIAEIRGITGMSNCSKGDDEIISGKYTINPHYWLSSSGIEKLVYYLAAKEEKNYRFDWVILPGSLEKFKNEETIDRRLINDTRNNFV